MLSDATTTSRGTACSATRRNAPYGARYFLTRCSTRGHHPLLPCLNAPYGARCFLTDYRPMLELLIPDGLNAPYGARRFLTEKLHRLAKDSDLKRLNAPYGARCFLTKNRRRTPHGSSDFVLMRLMAQGAF